MSSQSDLCYTFVFSIKGADDKRSFTATSYILSDLSISATHPSFNCGYIFVSVFTSSFIIITKLSNVLIHRFIEFFVFNYGSLPYLFSWFLWSGVALDKMFSIHSQPLILFRFPFSPFIFTLPFYIHLFCPSLVLSSPVFLLPLFFFFFFFFFSCFMVLQIHFLVCHTLPVQCLVTSNSPGSCLIIRNIGYIENC